MAKLHLKGHMLRVLLGKPDGLWDHEVARETMREYGLQGAYWKGTVRVTLSDLYSGGLIEEVDEALDDGTYFEAGKVLLKYRLTNFGRERMLDTGIV